MEFADNNILRTTHRSFLETFQQMMMLQLENIFITKVFGIQPVLLMSQHSTFSQFLLVSKRGWRTCFSNSNSCQSCFSLSFSFVCTLILMVNSTEVRNDDGHRKCDYKHTTKWTYATDNLSSNRFRYLNIWQVQFIVFAWLLNITHHVTITQSCHRNNCVPESRWNWRKVRSVNIFLGVEHDCGEYYDRHSERKDKKA